MKSELILSNREPKLRIYPYLGRAMRDGLVVLFCAPGTGMVVKAARLAHGLKALDNDYKIGSYMATWLERAFEPLPGSVVLTNDEGDL